MAKQKKNEVTTTSGWYDEMVPHWEMVDALLGGTATMRAHGLKYLPQHENETDKNYKNRLKMTTLLPAFEDVLNKLSGKPFVKDIVLGESIDEQIKEWCNDIDLQGNDLTSFARTLFRDGLARGFTHILIETPQAPVREDGSAPTKQDEKDLNLRPYFVHIPATSLFAAYATVGRDGKEVVNHIRISESEVQRDGFDEKLVERVRIIEPGKHILWEKRLGKWTEVETIATGTNKVCLVTFYTTKSGFMLCKPRLIELAHKNIEHWQSSSNQKNCLTVARFPILGGSGVAKTDGKQAVGPRVMLTTEDAAGRYYYIEHTGAALEAGRKELEDIKLEMAMHSAKLLMKPGNETATGKAIDTAEQLSEMQEMVVALEDALEQALILAAELANIDTSDKDKFSVDVFKDFGISMGDVASLDALLKLRTAGEISREAIIAEFKRRDVLSSGYDAAADKELIDEEGPSLGAMRTIADAAARAKGQPSDKQPAQPGQKDKKPKGKDE